jgi:hypothetical protein
MRSGFENGPHFFNQCPPTLTEDGVDDVFATHNLGHGVMVRGIASAGGSGTLSRCVPPVSRSPSPVSRSPSPVSRLPFPPSSQRDTHLPSHHPCAVRPCPYRCCCWHLCCLRAVGGCCGRGPVPPAPPTSTCPSCPIGGRPVRRAGRALTCMAPQRLPRSCWRCVRAVGRGVGRLGGWSATGQVSNL